MKLDLNYYKLVASTQSNPEILRSELIDLIKEVEQEIIGWEGYAWKDGIYYDSIQDYFNDKVETK